MMRQPSAAPDGGTSRADRAPQPHSSVSSFRMILALVSLGLIAACLAPGAGIVLEFPFFLLFGWALFLTRAAREATVVWPDVILALGALALLAVGTHRFCCWLYLSTAPPADAQPRAWPLRWTAAILALVLVMFIAGTAMIGVAHQVVWIARSDEGFVQWNWMMPKGARLAMSKGRMKQIGLALHNYHDAYGTMPPGGTFDRFGAPLHSWATHLLPYLDEGELFQGVRFDLPWNHPDQRAVFIKHIAILQNPAYDAQHERDAQGYSLSHYAANAHVLSANRGIRISEIPDGTSQTVLAGEVADRFKPWGHPVNWRDLKKGINKSSDGFGSPFAGGAHVLLADGSVRFIQENIDPDILRRLARPNDGEVIPDF